MTYHRLNRINTLMKKNVVLVKHLLLIKEKQLRYNKNVT